MGSGTITLRVLKPDPMPVRTSGTLVPTSRQLGQHAVLPLPGDKGLASGDGHQGVRVVVARGGDQGSRDGEIRSTRRLRGCDWFVFLEASSLWVCWP